MSEKETIRKMPEGKAKKKKDEGSGEKNREPIIVEALLNEYEDVLLGRKNDFSNIYLKCDAPEKDVAELLRYAFRDLLGFTPQDMFDYISPKLIETLRLKRAINKIDYPPELKNNKYDNLKYLASVVYPDEVKMSESDIVIGVYKQVLSGEKAKYPKNFFNTSNHATYVVFCLQYAISTFLPDIRSSAQLYRKFADKSWAESFLKKCNLFAAYRNVWPDTLSFLDYCMEYMGQSNKLEYGNIRFNNLLDKIREEKVNEDND